MTFVSGETVSDLILRMLVGPSMRPGWHRGVEGSRTGAQAKPTRSFRAPQIYLRGVFLTMLVAHFGITLRRVRGRFLASTSDVTKMSAMLATC